MASCVTLPALGTLCGSDLTLRLGGMRIELWHPATAAVAVIVAAILIFVFRDPT